MAVTKKNRLLVFTIAMALVFSLTTVCLAKGPKYGGTLVQGFGVYPNSLDVHVASGGSSRVLVSQYNNNLIDSDQEGNLLPGLATSWEFSDPLTLIFHLRKGVKFQDGTDFNAEAVKYNFERLAGKTEPKITSPAKRTAGGFQLIEVVDPYTVKIKMKGPDAGILSFMHGWFTAMVSPAAVKKWGDKYLFHLTGTGPFILKKHIPGSQILYEKWDGYWKKDKQGNALPYLDKMKIMIIPDPATREAALRSGTIDLDQELTAKHALRLKKDPDIKVITLKGFLTKFLPLNTGKPPMDNVWFRKAINLAIDRQEIIASVHQGEGSIPNGFFSPISWAYDSNLKWYEYNPEKAKEALKKSGLPEGVSFKAAVYNPQAKAEAEMVQAQLKRVGINMVIDNVDFATFNSQYRRQGLYHAAFTGYPQTGYDPGFLSFVFHFSKGPYADPGRPTMYDAAALQARGAAAGDREKRKEIFAKLHKLVYDNAGEIYLAWTNGYRAHRAYVKNFKLSADQFSAADEVWLDKK
ncbi:MAG: ABC transporter substrate-binding protein [Deltaproteobacteria bacterium]|nr:ABC transporter substrate-binding protein [Deltaproteobacteria bacterium]